MRIAPSAGDLSREAELLTYDLLGRPPLPTLQRLVDLASQLCGGATAEINAVTATEQVHLATTTRSEEILPREVTFCSKVVELHESTFAMADAREHPDFAANPYVTGERANIRFYAATQLRTNDTDVVIGTLCVFAEHVRQPDPLEIAALQTLAQVVVEVMENHRRGVALKGLLERIYEQDRELLRSNESLAGFAGQVSHDLQGPLASIRMALDLLAEPPGQDEGSRRFLLDRAVSGADRMRRTIIDLMDFATIGGGRPPERVDVDAALAEVLQDLDQQVQEMGAEVAWAPLPPVLAHEAEVRAVLQNLISNAVKHAAAVTEPYVRVTGGARPDSRGLGQVVRIEVTDNGPGISADQHDAVFEMLVRGTTEVDGRGIGLATCARLVRSRGGQIGVEEAADGGAVFWFELPAAV